MARQKKKQKRLEFPELPDFKEHLLFNQKVRVIVGIILFVLGILLVLPAFGMGGVAGQYMYVGLKWIAGIGYFLFPLLFIALSVSFFRAHQGFPTSKVVSGILALLAALGMVGLVASGSGGVVGSLVASPLISLFDLYATFLILAAVFIISVLVLFELELTPPSLQMPQLNTLTGIFSKKRGEEEFTVTGGDSDDEILDEEPYDNDDAQGEAQPPTQPVQQKPLIATSAPEVQHTAIIRTILSEYVAPPLALLEKDRGKAGTGDIKANANIIRRTLQNFGIQVEMDEVSIGPSVTRYAIKPAEGVRLSKIVSLQNNLELTLAAHPVRIEAPIPGKSLVGIEVPNTTKSTVGLGSLFSTSEFAQSEKQLLTALGKDIAGVAHFANIAKMPHLLIAGTTGSGKSVALHSLIISLLYRNGPNELRFIMIDPKRLELPLYKGIPHLLTPVITDPKKAIMSLKWAAKEMERRLAILEAESVQNIDMYHKTVYAPAKKRAAENPDEIIDLPESMPYIVIVLDELAEIMQTFPREMEASIVRLAQLSRAAGIHLVIATQRPEVKVVTGLIKANMPGRIALKVNSLIDSRVILDASGAENLLGFGDMLYSSSDTGKPHRIQGAFVTGDEIKKVVDFIKKNNEGSLDDIDFDKTAGNGDAQGSFAGDVGDDDDDDLYDQAKGVVEEAGKASTSYIQRKLRVGYSRAARLMDILEKRGVIGPADGSKPRDVLTKKPGTLPSPEEDV
jgi:S-DNA-T family DNA segregation ATPase FtsK/SpoIIIE